MEEEKQKRWKWEKKLGRRRGRRQGEEEGDTEPAETNGEKGSLCSFKRQAEDRHTLLKCAFCPCQN